MIIRRTDVLPMRPARPGQTGSHFLDDATGHAHADDCQPAAWRHSKYVGVAILCLHKRVVKATPSDENHALIKTLPYWAPLCRSEI